MPPGTCHRPPRARVLLLAAVTTAGATTPRPRLAQEARRFDAPQHRGYRVDVCLNWSRDCGQPAADAFCWRQGSPGAAALEIAEDVGAARPTITLGDGRARMG